MTVIVLKNKVTEKRGFLILLELYFYVGLAGSGGFGVDFAPDINIGLNYCESVVFARG